MTPANVDGLVAAIASLMDNPALRRQMASRSRERIADQYELRKNVLRLSNLFSRKMRQDRGVPSRRTENRLVNSPASYLRRWQR